MKKLLLYLLVIIINVNLFSQNNKRNKNSSFSINGYVEDLKSGERLIGCVLNDSINNHNIATNSFGYFNLTLDKGVHSISFHYLGYANKSIVLSLKSDTSIIVKLIELTTELKEITVTNSKVETILSKPQSGIISLNNKDIKNIPALLGEADVMRAIQVLPGIQAANERSPGISVRGGSIDQNLFLLDDAPIFQISHMLGFYSVFNNDVVKNIKVYKGDIPANYGGRLSSLIDVRLKDGNMQNYAISGGIGLISSKLNVEGPIVKNKISLLVSGKYAYIGWLYKQIEPQVNKLSFFDLNFKLNAIINKKNRIYLSSYNGSDYSYSSNYKNNTLSLRWNHLNTTKLFNNISMIYSNYNYVSGNNNNYSSYTWKSGMNAITLKTEYNYFKDNNNTIDFGLSTTLNNFIPGKLEGNIEVINQITLSTPFSQRVVTQQKILDHAVYISNQQKVTDKLTFRYGLRASLYQDLGGHWIYNLANYQVIDSFYSSSNKTFFNYFSLEPRLSINFRLNSNSAIKGSYTYTTQPTQLLTRTNGGGPLDIWFPSDNNIKPQISSQFSCTYVQYIFNNLLELSVDCYYKTMKNIIDYKDGATFLNKSASSNINKTPYNFEEQLRTGKGYAYGSEFLIKFDNGKLNGFINYTYARSKRKIDGINSGKIYLSPFDKPHTIDVSINLILTKRISLNSNYRYQSGQVTTIPIFVVAMFEKTFNGYSNRNDYRLPYYSRLDLSLTIKNKEKPSKRFHSDWNFSIINITNHANISSVDFNQSKANPDVIDAKGLYILGFTPSVSYHFNF